MTDRQPTPHSDLLEQIRSTGSVRASASTLVHGIRQRLEMIVSQRMDPVASINHLINDLRDHDAIVGAITHGTDRAHRDQDQDPTAPKAAFPSGQGGVYGSLGPEDTDTQRNTSLGYAGANPAIPEQNIHPRVPYDRQGSTGGEERRPAQTTFGGAETARVQRADAPDGQDSVHAAQNRGRTEELDPPQKAWRD